MNIGSDSSANESHAGKPTGTYPVGYGKPPVEGQFQKGRSGNPKGRPRRKVAALPHSGAMTFGTQPANLLAMEEAYRQVTIREGDKVIELPAIQALFRSTTNAAIKGDRFARRDLLDFTQKIENADRELRCEYFETMVELKTHGEREIAQARARTSRARPGAASRRHYV